MNRQQQIKTIIYIKEYIYAQHLDISKYSHMRGFANNVPILTTFYLSLSRDKIKRVYV